ncbi:unnamed protein product [Ceutorhynchus assimilis]|uniref:Uncharacterized protein n=1 Tax=Ceutorhynchus assimilis TaxID=467358 RepID=A0A9N9MSL7_9CUCU|nr:unnamed protein product [Ceutorhynchus assimilis]
MPGILAQNTLEEIKSDNTKSYIDNEENIIVIYEDYGNTSNETHKDNFSSSKGILLDRHNVVNLNIDDTNLHNGGKISESNTDDIWPLMSTPKSDLIPRNEDKERRGQKRKVQFSKHEINNTGKVSVGGLINNKKIQLIDKKISVLDIMKKVEEENLKGEILDNEIKAIIKEKELIELKAKKNSNTYPNIIAPPRLL